MLLKNSSALYRRITLLMVIVFGFMIACSNASDSGQSAGADENLNLDYSTHKLEEKPVWLTNNTEKLIASPKAKKGGTFYAFPSADYDSRRLLLHDNKKLTGATSLPRLTFNNCCLVASCPGYVSSPPFGEL